MRIVKELNPTRQRLECRPHPVPDSSASISYHSLPKKTSPRQKLCHYSAVFLIPQSTPECRNFLGKYTIIPAISDKPSMFINKLYKKSTACKLWITCPSIYSHPGRFRVTHHTDLDEFQHFLLAFQSFVPYLLKTYHANSRLSSDQIFFS